MEWKPASLEGKIGLQFKNKDILRLSLIHPSYAQQIGEPDFDNQRLEWLGESILKLIAIDYLYRNCPYLEVSKLTALEDKLIQEERLTKLWLKLNLGDNYPFFSLKGDRYVLSQKRKNPFESACKALIGAIYLDRGFSQTRTWITKQLIAPLLESHLKSNKERITPEKQLKFLGSAVFEVIVKDYLYQQLPCVNINCLNSLYRKFTANEAVKTYLNKLNENDFNLIDTDHKTFAKKSFICLIAALYLQFSNQTIKGSFRKTVEWFTQNFMDDEELLKEAIYLLLKDNKPQKWIITNVLGYESKRYQEGKERFHELIDD